MSSSEEPPIRSEDTQLHELLVLVLDRIAEHGLSGASAILEQHPEHADELRRRLRKLQAAGLLPSPEGAAEELPERLGDFRLLRQIGSGGMGIVYLARQVSLGRDVALKLVRPDQLFFPGARERFRREVEAIARLQDPGIVAIHTVGEESGIPFFAMEFVEGATLTELVLQLQGRAPAELRGGDLLDALRRQVPPTASAAAPGTEFAGSWPDACVRVLVQVVRAVAHAHAHGVLHRDLKSANVMLRQDGRPVVLDFGLAQPRGASRLTRTGAPLGTLHAMAPEQLRAEHDAVDERTDVYALGVLFYELLTLRPPFVGGSYDVVARQILDANPPLPSRLNAGVTWDCETVCLTAMEPEPARR
ncbi:MAG: serine/threonine protein kinase, partial [Planctomycetes bacterium]|nr:serine/threonine protein kinase [Planctomycetota bacterium]